jgi:long-subunit acyl-CoA synthetase (AMP-forming)
MSFLLDTLRQHAARLPGGIALEDGDGQALDWQALVDAIAAEQDVLRAQLAGQRPVALQADHGIAHIVADLALMECAIPVLSLPLFFTSAQRSHALAHGGVQAMLHDADGELRCELLHGLRGAGALPQHTARISYTSGSTGAPKGICLSAEHLLQVAQGVAQGVGQMHVGRHLSLLPPGLLLENVAGCYASLLAGGTYIAASQVRVGLAAPFRPDFQRMAAAIAMTRATSTILVPEYLAGLVAWLERSHERLPRLTLVAVGGARVSAALLERARRVELPVRQGYGLTECGSVVCLDDATGQPGSVGHPLGTHRIRIAADGEILIDGPTHLGMVGAPLSEVARNGGCRTGDLGRFDAQGRLWIEGRKSNRIITSFGRNVSPEWIESLLLEQRAIAQAMVHGDGQARLSALLVPRDTEAAVAAAVAAVNATLPEYARVARWRHVAPFTLANGQLTGTGRLRRPQILSRYMSEESVDAVL